MLVHSDHMIVAAHGLIRYIYDLLMIYVLLNVSHCINTISSGRFILSFVISLFYLHFFLSDETKRTTETHNEKKINNEKCVTDCTFKMWVFHSNIWNTIEIEWRFSAYSHTSVGSVNIPLTAPSPIIRCWVWESAKWKIHKIAIKRWNGSDLVNQIFAVAFIGQYGIALVNCNIQTSECISKRVENGTWNCKLRLTNPIKSNKIKRLCIACEILVEHINSVCSYFHLRGPSMSWIWNFFLIVVVFAFQCRKNMTVWIGNCTNKNNQLKYELSRVCASFCFFHSWTRGGFATHFLFLHFIANLIYSWGKNEEIEKYPAYGSDFSQFLSIVELWRTTWRYKTALKLWDFDALLKKRLK